MFAQRIATLGLVLALGACATIVEGTDQTVNVRISPENAICEMSQKGQVIATIGNGGGQIRVPKSRENISVTCTAPGYQKQVMAMESSASGWGVVGCFLIDLCITDYSTGALNKYNDTVTIRLSPSSGGNLAAAPAMQNYSAASAATIAPAAGRSVMPAVYTAPEHPPVLPKPATSRTWQTAHNNVRGYWGSNAERDFYPMPSTVPLTLVQSKGDWGLFEYAAANQLRGQVWILMREVKETR